MFCLPASGCSLRPTQRVRISQETHLQMMMPRHGKAFLTTGAWCRESAGHWYPHKGLWYGDLILFVVIILNNLFDKEIGGERLKSISIMVINIYLQNKENSSPFYRSRKKNLLGIELPKHRPTYQGRVVNPWHQTKERQLITKPETHLQNSLVGTR